MHIMTFSERPYFDVSEDDIIANGSSYFGLSNTHFDPVRVPSSIMNILMTESTPKNLASMV